MSGQLRPDPTRGETGGKNTIFFLKVFQLCEFLLKSLQFFAKIRSSRDLFKNEVLGQNFDFGLPHTLSTFGDIRIFEPKTWIFREKVEISTLGYPFGGSKYDSDQ